jgi:DNA-binding PadR family transcriptional regulator
MHGYEIITKIRKNFGVYFGPSTIYPLLTILEKKGYIQSAWNMNSERPRKIYSLTNNGQNMLNFTEESLNLICRKIGTPTNTETIQQTAPSTVTLVTKKNISEQTNRLSLQIH